MRVLALDTTTRAGSVAVVEDEAVRFVSEGEPTPSHAERLPGDLLHAVRALGLTTSDIDLFAVLAGPGSFTGLRIGIAAMQGLAVVHGRRIVPVSALRALGVAASEGLAPGAIVGAWMDAHRGEVFSALWRVAAAPRYSSDGLVELAAAAVGAPGATLSRWLQGGHHPAAIAGDGATAYPADIMAGTRVVAAPPLAPIAGLMAAGLAAAGGSVDPAGVQPIYVRRPDAEVARDALRQRSDGRRDPPA